MVLVKIKEVSTYEAFRAMSGWHTEALSRAVFISPEPFVVSFYTSVILPLSLSREVKKRIDEDDSKSITNLTGTNSKKTIQMKNCCNS